MIYAGVDVAKANHVIGAVGDDGQPLCKSMEFKNSDAGFERCSAWLEAWPRSRPDVFVGMRPPGTTGWPCLRGLPPRPAACA